MKRGEKALILAGRLALSGYGKAEPLFPHEPPVLSEQGNHIEIVAGDSTISIEQAKALVHHYRARIPGYTGLCKLGQVLVKVPWTSRYTHKRAYMVFIIFNELPDRNGERFIINDKGNW